MMNAGLGQMQISSLFAGLNINSPCHTSMKERENEIGGHLEKFAQASVMSALVDEVNSNEHDKGKGIKNYFCWNN